MFERIGWRVVAVFLGLSLSSGAVAHTVLPERVSPNAPANAPVQNGLVALPSFEDAHAYQVAGKGPKPIRRAAPRASAKPQAKAKPRGVSGAAKRFTGTAKAAGARAISGARKAAKPIQRGVSGAGKSVASGGKAALKGANNFAGRLGAGVKKGVSGAGRVAKAGVQKTTASVSKGKQAVKAALKTKKPAAKTNTTSSARVKAREPARKPVSLTKKRTSFQTAKPSNSNTAVNRSTVRSSSSEPYKPSAGATKPFNTASGMRLKDKFRRAGGGNGGDGNAGGSGPKGGGGGVGPTAGPKNWTTFSPDGTRPGGSRPSGPRP